MAKALWQGYVVLGQLGIPVRLYGATAAARPAFVQLHDKDDSPLERILQCRREALPIRSNEVLRAVEYEPGRYVPLTARELMRAAPDGVKTIAVHQFCDETAVDPLYYERPLYVVPMVGGERAYALIRDVFAHSSACAVARFALYGREHIGVLRRHGDLLVLLQLRFAAELLPREQIHIPALPKPTQREVDVLTALVERFRGPLYLQDYHDEYTQRVRALIERKIRGLPLRHAERRNPHATPEEEIVPALQRALSAGQTLDEQTQINRYETP